MSREDSTPSPRRKHPEIKVGDRFGRLAVVGGPISVLNPTASDPTRKALAYRCRCDCGNRHTVLAVRLRGGRTKSCGCLRAVQARRMGSVSRPKHGHAQRATGCSPEYKAWCHIKERCLNPNHPNWHNYGGRGITVCDEWRDSFEAFIDDMGPRPSSGHTIERTDNDRGYSKDNCVWATRQEQAENRRNSVYLEHDGERRTITAWSRVVGIPEPTICQRLQRGWTVAEALTRRPKHEKSPLIEYNGESRTLSEWSQITGIDYRALHSRHKRGWDASRMLNTPAQKRTRKD